MEKTNIMKEYQERMDWIMMKLDDDATPDKIKIDILNFLELADKTPCKKCTDWFDKMMKLTKDI